MPKDLHEALQELLDTLTDDVIDIQRVNGDDCNPETGAEYDWTEGYFVFYIVVPDDWEIEAES